MRLEIRDGAGAGTAVEVEQDRFVVGRDESCDLTLGGDPEASRRHAEFRRRPDGGWEVDDLGSRNGTLVDGRRIAGATPLTEGATIKVGQTTLAALETAPE